MAQRGSPLPVVLRLAIKESHRQTTVRELARELNVSKTTVQKYGGKKNGTK